MNTITVFSVLVIILFALTVPVHGQQPYTFSIRPSFGLVSGHAEELVYPDGGTKAPLLSELLWNMKPVFYYGGLLDFSQARPGERWGWFSRFSLKWGIPGASGIHENRDWQSIENTDLTDYSVHDNYTRELFFIDFSAGLSFPLHRTVVLRTFINASFTRFSFYGMDGHGTYARRSCGCSPQIICNHQVFYPITDDPTRIQWEGKIISYTQEWLYVAPGVSVSYFFHDIFFAEVSFLVSPLIVCFGMDEHKTTNVQYRDYMQGGILLEPGLRVSFAAGKWLDIIWDISWRFISGTKGTSYQRSIGTGTYLQGGDSGAGLSIMTTGIGLNIKL